MALTQCPECGREVSDKAESCSNCGCPLAQRTAAKKKASLKTGSIIGLIGGVSYALFWALAYSGAFTSNQDKGEGTSAYIDLSATWMLLVIGTVCAVLVTVLFIVALVAGHRFRRSAAIGVSVAALVVSLAALLCIVFCFNYLVICVGWLFLWEPVLEVVGSAKMLSAALKYEDA